MDILGIGFPELILILVIALMVFGPRRLPEIAAKLGRYARILYSQSQEVRTVWRSAVAEAARQQEGTFGELKKTLDVL